MAKSFSLRKGKAPDTSESLQKASINQKPAMYSIKLSHLPTQP